MMHAKETSVALRLFICTKGVSECLNVHGCNGTERVIRTTRCRTKSHDELPAAGPQQMLPAGRRHLQRQPPELWRDLEESASACSLSMGVHSQNGGPTLGCHVFRPLFVHQLACAKAVQMSCRTSGISSRTPSPCERTSRVPMMT